MRNGDFLLHKIVKLYLRGSLSFSPTMQNHVRAMNLEWQQTFLDLTVNTELVQTYPLSSRFSTFFFKLLISYLETNVEVHEDMYKHLIDTMNSCNGNSFSYRHYVIGNDLSEVMTIKESRNIVVDGTTGMRTWEAAIMLADWALRKKEIFLGKKVLELGSGVGFTGLTIAKHCAPHSMHLTDCHSKILNFICDNININFPNIEEENVEEILFKNNEQEIGAFILDWNAIENLSDSIVPDIVIGTDIVYDPTIIQPLCEVLKTFFNRNPQLTVYIASVIRNANTFKAFLNALDTFNFSYVKLPMKRSVYIEWDKNVQKCLLKITC